MRFLAISLHVLFITGCSLVPPRELTEPPHNLPLDTYRVIEKTKDGLEILDRHTEEFVPTCAKEKTCSLRKIELRTEKYQIWVDHSYTYGTRMKASYQTDSVERLTDYVFVQFIRGCAYSVRWVENKRILEFGRSRELFGEHVRFHHPRWVIDSMDSSPAFYTDDEHVCRSAHHFYLWSRRGDIYAGSHVENFGNKKPKNPELYVIDSPSGAYHTEYIFPSAHNVSLEFRMCLYRTTDVPERLEPEDVNFAEPVHCFEWRSSSIYNWETKQIEHPRGIVPACFQKPPE